VAAGLADAGYSVILAGRRLDKLLRAAQQIGDRAFPIVMDVSIPEAVTLSFDRIAAHFGRLDLLFNNAGTGVPGSVLLEDVSHSDWAGVVDTNLSGAFYCTQGAFRLMKRQDPMGGRIINNGSVSAHAPRPNSAPYTATKHAITGLTKSASLDGRKYNIAVGQIDIGNAATDMTKAMEIGMLQANGTIAPEPIMDVGNVVQIVRQMAALPLEANVQFVTVMATDMPFVGRG
jgi:NAD(P)-dependent dehydrogenase (short-subunit alcohol dehydrogenase family)